MNVLEQTTIAVRVWCILKQEPAVRFELSAPVEQDGGRRAGQPADITYVFNVSINSNVWLKCDIFNIYLWGIVEFKS